jgi:hypothetical protein
MMNQSAGPPVRPRHGRRDGATDLEASREASPGALGARAHGRRPDVTHNARDPSPPLAP